MVLDECPPYPATHEYVEKSLALTTRWAERCFAYFHKYIHPTIMSITVSAEALLCVIAGGAGTLSGPLIGVFIVMVLKNYVSAYVERWNMLLGIVFVLIVLFMPSGITPWVTSQIRRLKERVK